MHYKAVVLGNHEIHNCNGGFLSVFLFFMEQSSQFISCFTVCAVYTCILVHQVSDFLVHLAKVVHITASSRVDAFVFNKEVFEPSFKLVPLPYNS